MKFPLLLPPIRRVPVRWVFEALLIVISVALGFWVTQVQEARQNREHAARVLEGILVEVEHNLTILERFVPMHTTWAEALEKADTSISTQSGLDVFFAARPPFPAGVQAPFPFLRRSAWDVALAGGGLRLIEYDVAAGLSDVYRMQEIATRNVDRLANAFSAAEPFDPARRGPSVRLLWLTVADIASAEALLLDLYRKHLPRIRAATNAER